MQPQLAQVGLVGLGTGVYYPLGNEHSYRKSPLLIGKSTISNYFYGHFPISTLNYQRVPVKNLQKSNDGKKILNLTQNSEKKYGFGFFKSCPIKNLYPISRGIRHEDRNSLTDLGFIWAYGHPESGFTWVVLYPYWFWLYPAVFAFRLFQFSSFGFGLLESQVFNCLSFSWFCTSSFVAVIQWYPCVEWTYTYTYNILCMCIYIIYIVYVYMHACRMDGWMECNAMQCNALHMYVCCVFIYIYTVCVCVMCVCICVRVCVCIIDKFWF